jgi:hypothetical protein
MLSVLFYHIESEEGEAVLYDEAGANDVDPKRLFVFLASVIKTPIITSLLPQRFKQ